MSISDERLAEIQRELTVPNRKPSTRDQADIFAALTELQSLRAAAKVRAIREGDGEADSPFGHEYGEGPKLADMMAASPIPTAGGEKE